MGWNSWDAYGASVTEQEVLANADALARDLAAAGFTYVVVDIQWYEPGADGSRYRPWTDLVMDEWGRLWPAPNRFPSAAGGAGFTMLGETLHARGLQFGIHLMRGIPRQAVHRNTPVKGMPGVSARDIAQPNSICPWNTDMYGVNPSHPAAQAYYDSVFELYAAWGVDFVKVDDIAWSRLYGYHAGEVELIHHAIARCGRPMVLSLSPGPASLATAAHLRRHATTWRLTDDLWDRWRDILHAFDTCAAWAGVQGAGAYPDADMLPLGHLGIRSTDGGGGDRWTRLTAVEQRTMVTLWMIARSPLILGGAAQDYDPPTLDLLRNPAVLTVSRDTYGNREVFRDDTTRAWVARHQDGESAYLALFNVGEEARRLSLGDEWLPLDADRWTVTDLWEGEEDQRACLGSVNLPPHGAALWRVVPSPGRGAPNP
jgi:hypothetical protein